MKRFILLHSKRHPRKMGVQEVQQFPSHLAVEGRVAASTQSQVLSAILFLYQQVLKQDIGWIDEVVRAKQPHRVPVVLTQDEVAAVLRPLVGPHMDHGHPPVWRGPATDGVHSPTGERRRLFLQSNRGARRQRPQGPGDDATPRHAFATHRLAAGYDIWTVQA